MQPCGHIVPRPSCGRQRRFGGSSIVRSRFAAFPLNGCVNGESRRCNRLSSLSLCSSSKTASRREIFHASNFDAKARSTAFSHRHIGGAWMTDVLHWGSLYGPRVQNLAAVTETVKSRAPARRGELFWELICCQCSAPVPQLFRRYSFRSSPGRLGAEAYRVWGLFFLPHRLPWSK